MTYEHTMATVMRLTGAAEALAALSARLRADVDGLELDPGIAAALDAVVGELGIDPSALSAEEKGATARFAHAFLRQACDLVDHPERPPGWVYDDPLVLRSQGRASAVIAGLIAQSAPAMDGLEAALGRDGAAICDVGAGVAGLCVAFCRTWPAARVTGLEPWPAAVRLAREEIAASGVEDRIELREQLVEDLDDADAFDLAWLPAPFLPPAILPAALERTHAALRPGGWIVFGLYAGPAEPLAERLADLRSIRSGGSATRPDEAAERLTAAGFTDVRELERTWQAPIRFVVGRRV
jgi:SAM-dependent methyltransferase